LSRIPGIEDNIALAVPVAERETGGAFGVEFGGAAVSSSCRNRFFFCTEIAMRSWEEATLPNGAPPPLLGAVPNSDRTER